MPDPIVRVEGLRKLFPVEKSLFRKTDEFIHAVDGLDFEIGKGESLGLVGESGCGKTTTGRLLAQLEEKSEGRAMLRVTRDADGEIDKGAIGDDIRTGASEYIDVEEMAKDHKREFRRRVQMIFQDPYESLNPRRTIFDTVSESLVVQGVRDLREREERVAELLQLAGLTPPQSFMFRHPHELSGGQRQRVAIARALVSQPEFVIADEPTSMLDVSIRIAIMELMLDLGERFDVSYLYITHDLAVARYMCDRIAVMYLGKIVEIAPTEELLNNPQHPYTRALLSSVPVPDPGYARPDPDIKGGISKPINPEPVCRFIERCPWAEQVCRDNEHPPLEEVASDHYVSCYVAARGDAPALPPEWGEQS